MLFIIAISFMVIGGVGASTIARAKHRNPAPWFAFGLFFPLPTIIAAGLSSRLPPPEERSSFLVDR
jgi:hypothetical protein